MNSEGERSMFTNIDWLFFDIGSTLVNERRAYEHRFRELAQAAGVSFEKVYETALGFYRQNQKGDLETAKLLGVSLTPWHTEDEILYQEAVDCLSRLHRNYRIGVIANQPPGTAERLKGYGILKYIALVVASGEEGVEKPDKRIFEIALQKSRCLPQNTVMIGDRIDNDILPANLLGMHTIWIKQGLGRYWKFQNGRERPEAQINVLSEIVTLL